MKKFIFGKNNIKENHIIIYGKHASLSAILNKNRTIKNIILAKENRKLEIELITLLKKTGKKILIEKVDKKFIEGLIGKNIKHQGILLLANKLIKKSFEEVFNKSNFRAGVLLDKITDPNNIGSIYRSALCFNLDFIVNLERGSSKETGSLLEICCCNLKFLTVDTTSDTFSMSFGALP